MKYHRPQIQSTRTAATVQAASLRKAGAKGTTIKDNRPAIVVQMVKKETLSPPGIILRKGNNTGLPDNLKSGIESLSGMSMDNVKVHYNSSKPAQLSAHAYAQGTDIHIAPGQEKHLPHEAWHVVQQAQGRVKPTVQLKSIAVNDDAGLEKEADVMGRKSSAYTGAPVQCIKKPVTRDIIQAYLDEEMLIARLRGIDNALRVYKGVANDLILKELEDLTHEMEDKRWFKAVEVILALREKYDIDQFPPPLIPFDSPEIIGGKHFLESRTALPLPRPLSRRPPQVPGSTRIELGAGDMASAATLGSKDSYTAYTEFRSQEEATTDYGEKLTGNLHKFDREKNPTNTIKFGVDATQEGPYATLPLTENLRFTNPNIGHQDIADPISELIQTAYDENEHELLLFGSMGISFWLNMERLYSYKKSTKSGNWIKTIITSTTNRISEVRNVYMLHKFLTNAPAKLIPGSGKVEIIVSTSYLDRWPIIQLARGMRYHTEVTNDYEMGFENVKTQEGSKVNDKPAKKSLITLYLPWGDALSKSSILTWVERFTGYTVEQPSLLSSVHAPDLD